MAFPYRTTVAWSESEACFVARVPAWNSEDGERVVARGASAEDALRNAFEATAAALEAAHADGGAVPESDLPPVEDRAQYDALLARIQALWNAELGTPAGDELGALLSAMEIYEEAHEGSSA